MYLWIRILHVLLGAIWVGTLVFTTVFLTPASAELGPDGAKLGIALKKRGFIVAMPVIAGITILTGIYLYWRYTAGFSPEVSRTHAGMAFGIGGLFGILGYAIGATLVGVNMAKATKIAQSLATAPASERAALLAKAQAHRARATGAAQVVTVLVILAVIFMAAAPRL